VRRYQMKVILSDVGFQTISLQRATVFH